MKEYLKQFGFSDKETSIYGALLELGSAPVSEIAKKAKVKRPTAYVVLDTLAERGLVSATGDRGVKLYRAAPPDRLIRHLEEEAKKYSALASEARKVLPRIKIKRTETNQKPKVQFFEGAAGIKSVYEDVLSSLEGIRTQAFREQTFKVFPATSKEFGKVPEITIYGNKIILVSPAEKFAAVVESKELVNTLKKALATSQKQARFMGERKIRGAGAVT